MADALDQLAARLDDPTFVHWTEAELTRYLNEAIRTLSAFTQRYRARGTFNTVANQSFYNLPTVLPTLRGYNVTNQDLIVDIEYALMEPPTPTVWTGSEQFTLPLIVEALDSALQQFLVDTGVVLLRSLTAGVTPDADGRITLSSTVVTIRRAAWVMANGTVIPLKREDEWGLTHFAPAWPQNPAAPDQTWPTGYSVGVTPPLVVQLAPAPLVAGTLDLLYVETGATIDTTNTLIWVPDDWSWVIKWRALAQLLSRDGLAYDPQRAAYCEARYEQGVQMVKAASVVLNGAINGALGTLRSVVETDQYRRGWQTTPGAPTALLTAGHTVVGLKPRPDSTNYEVMLDVVRNVPIATDLTDCLVVDEPMRDAYLDYAQHLAIWKEGPGQLQQAMGLYDRFMKACGVTVKLNQAEVPNRGPLLQQTVQDERIKAREEEPEPTLP